MKKYFHRLLFPNRYVTAALVVLSAVLLTGVFTNIITFEPIDYIAYFLSAYALTVVCAAVAVRVKGFLKTNKYTAPFMNDMELRGRVSLYTGVIVNFAYAVMKLASGIIYGSDWSLTLGFYYLILCVIRFVLSKDTIKRPLKIDAEKRLIHAYKSYRFCGGAMLFLHIAVTSMAVLMIYRDKSYDYPGTLIYANAAFAFYCVITSAVNLVKFKKADDPILSASKAVSFAGALMSIFALQTAMLVRFGGDHEYRRLMNSLTGGAVCFIIFIMAVYMFIHGTRMLKKLRGESTNPKGV